MDIEMLKGKRVKICPRSITCKDVNGKTCGVVNDVCSFLNLPARYQFDLCRKFNRHTVNIHNVYVRNNKELFYLLDLRKIEFYERYIQGHDSFETDDNNYHNMIQGAKEAEKSMKVIPCYII